MAGVRPDTTRRDVVERTAAPLRRSVVEALRQSIVLGRLAPGARLIERELIEMMGVSRTVVREALRQLEAEGLIDVVANKGAVVRNLSRAEAEDLYAIRAVLEGLAARLFTEHADKGALDELTAALARTVEAYKDGLPTTIVEAKNTFYEILFRGAGSEALSAMIDALQARVWRWRVLGVAHPQRSEQRSAEAIRDLKALVAAVAAGDAALAERIARTEVMNAAAEALRLIGEHDQTAAKQAV
jgi:GntR family transcriptional regulator, trigonelline degradation regulator